MTQHTPTPWAVDPDHRPGMGWNAHVVEAADPNNRVCFMTSGSEGKINAAFIVKAVNRDHHFDALVKALEKAHRWFEMSNDGQVGTDYMNGDSGKYPGNGYADSEALQIELRGILDAVGLPPGSGK